MSHKNYLHFFDYVQVQHYFMEKHLGLFVSVFRNT